MLSTEAVEDSSKTTNGADVSIWLHDEINERKRENPSCVKYVFHNFRI